MKTTFILVSILTTILIDDPLIL